MNYIISRHPGVLTWLRSKGITGRIARNVPAEAGAGDAIYGKLPPREIRSLLLRGAKFFWTEMPYIPRDVEMKDITPAFMEESGASFYEVLSVEVAE